MKNSISRRFFLKSSLVSGTWLVTIGFPGAASANPTKREHWCVYLLLHSDNRASLYSPVMEGGQFMRTTGPMIMAEEMDLDWQTIDFPKEAPVHLSRNQEGGLEYSQANSRLGGSFAVARNWDYMRKAGASVRQLLRQEAASRWQVPLSEVNTKKSWVYHAKSDKTFSYGELAEKAAMRQINPDDFQLKPKKRYKIIGQNIKNIDAPEIVKGKEIYGIDVDYPNALHAVIARAPEMGGEVLSYNKHAALDVEGVIELVEIEREEGNHWLSGKTQIHAAGIAAVATSVWAAMQGKNKLQVKWQNSSEFKNQNSQKQLEEMRSLTLKPGATHVTRDHGDVNLAFANADIILDAIYEKPLLAHACMEPMNCLADIREDSATIVTGAQAPHRLAEAVEDICGIDALKVELQCVRMGGAFGRRSETDYVREAIKLSRRLKKPIKVTWTREDDLERDFFGPAAIQRVRASLKNGKLTGWHHIQAATKGGAQDSCFPAGLVDNYKVELCEYASHLPAGAWRGPMHLQWAFAAESMMDELAYAAKIDPLDFRLQLMSPARRFAFHNWGADSIDSGRMAACYRAAAIAAKWSSKRPPGHGLGIAGHFTHGSYAAFVIEVSVKENALNLHNAWGAIDCGIAINPNHIRAQMEGGFIEGLNAALFNKANVENSRVINNNFDTLRWIRNNEAPLNIESIILDNDHSPTGVGEPPTAPAAAALANAIYAACGKRIRRMPFSESIHI